MEMEFESEPERESRRLTEYEVQNLKYNVENLVEGIGLEKYVINAEMQRGYPPFELDVPRQHQFEIVSSIKRLFLWLSIRKRSGKEVPVAEISSDVVSPIDVIGSLYGEGEMKEVPEDREIRTMAKLNGHQVIYRGESFAKEVVVDGVVNSLTEAHNFNKSDEAAGSAPGYQSGAVPGLGVTVYTKHQSVPVLYSGASFIRYDQRFSGSLSSPVSDYINPGRYIFGVRLQHGQVWESTASRIPPNYQIHTFLA